MKKEDMHEALSGIAEKYVEEAAPRRRRRAPMVAACACVLAFALIIPVAVGRLTSPAPADNTPTAEPSDYAAEGDTADRDNSLHILTVSSKDSKASYLSGYGTLKLGAFKTVSAGTAVQTSACLAKPPHTVGEKLTWEQVCEYLDRDVTPAYIPEGLYSPEELGIDREWILYRVSGTYTAGYEVGDVYNDDFSLFYFQRYGDTALTLHSMPQWASPCNRGAVITASATECESLTETDFYKNIQGAEDALSYYGDVPVLFYREYSVKDMTYTDGEGNEVSVAVSGGGGKYFEPQAERNDSQLQSGYQLLLADFVCDTLAATGRDLRTAAWTDAEWESWNGILSENGYPHEERVIYRACFAYGGVFYEIQSSLDFENTAAMAASLITANDPEGEIIRLSDGIDTQEKASSELKDSFIAASCDFSAKLLNNGINAEKNTLLCPVSAMYALSMTANGAGGQTLAQLEDAMGGLSTEELNDAFNRLKSVFASRSKPITVANSVWYRNNKYLKVKEPFLQDLLVFYGAEAYSAPFNTATKDAINAWVNENTKGLIPSIIDDDISQQAMIYLINALYFKDGWADAFNMSYEGTFTAANGAKQQVDMLLGTCSDQMYIEGEGVKGFEKRYDSGYKFVALLPDEGNADDLAASLTGEKLQKILHSTHSGRLTVHVPAFEAGSYLDLKSTLQAMGVTDVFTGKADLSGMSDTPICVSSILQKTRLSFDRYGSEAAAVTNVESQRISSAIVPPEEEEEREIIVDRPFVYLILSRDNVPVFIGIQNSIE